MRHYICTGGCNGVSQKPGKCNTKGCPLYQHPLIPCDCKDNKHALVLEKAEKS